MPLPIFASCLILKWSLPSVFLLIAVFYLPSGGHLMPQRILFSSSFLPIISLYQMTQKHPPHTFHVKLERRPPKAKAWAPPSLFFPTVHISWPKAAPTAQVKTKCACPMWPIIWQTCALCRIKWQTVADGGRGQGGSCLLEKNYFKVHWSKVL